MRFLLATANFAPRSGSHPTRTVHLTKFLRQAGHEVRVVTYDEDQQTLYSVRDDSLSQKVPADVQVRRIRPGWFHRVLGGAKRRGGAVGEKKLQGSRNPLAALMIPDPHFSAQANFVRAIEAEMSEWSADVLLTFAYPFTLTLVGAAVKKKHPGLFWIADYGDPWSGSVVRELANPSWRRSLDSRLESKALAHADAITVTTEPTADLYRRQFPDLADRVHVVTMGYDPDDASGIPARERTAEEKDRIILLHAGRLYGEARDPKPFLEGVEQGLAADPERFSRLRIVLLGEVEDSIVADIENSPARELFDLHGWVTVEQSVAWMKAADHLLLFGNRGAMQIPGKIFQYFGTGRPVFMVRETEDDPTLDVIARYGRASVAANRADEIRTALDAVLREQPKDAEIAGGCEEFSWPALAGQLIRIAETTRDGR